MTALVVHDLLGGELLEAEVDHADGSHQGFHYWNRFAGVDVDLTRRQFTDGEVVLPPHLIERLPDVPWLAQEQYVIFRDRRARRAAGAGRRATTELGAATSGRLGRHPVEVEVGMALVLQQAGDPLPLVGDVQVDAVDQELGPAE